ncbi:dipeptidyl aminopeptidase/acylaminoacyl peptidase [Brevundimonas variabilis]|uniref:Dipeptidyl aminopeptidase/acylaminoacyl peptidase n=1 Tax=Brevundimonas variabilis TaxID=74312 RepID=A0A7W9FF59_9CAUL|nr:dipeptidyl aminopeptidase/acylaminoacyl peptidase [Brevundimonas variabilis]
MQPILGLAAAATLLVAANPTLCQTSAQPSQNHPFTIDDLVGHEGIGNVRISTDSRWIVLERQAPWNTASTYKYDFYTETVLSRLQVFSATDGVLRHTLEDPGHSAGFVSGPFSPSGAQMVVYRLSESGWSMGVLTLATGTVRWLDLSPELARFGETVVWRSENELLVVARRNGALPYIIGVYAQSVVMQTELWRRAEAGHAPSSISTPSGAARDNRDKGTPLQLLRVELTTGRETILTEGAIIDVSLSPDARTAAALLDGPDIQYGLDTVLFTGTPKMVRRIILADLETGSIVEPLPDQDFASHLMAWSPRSDRLIVFARRPGDRFEAGQFWLLDRSGSARAVDLNETTPWIDGDSQTIPIPRASWDDDRPVFQVRMADGSKAWLTSDRDGRRRIVAQVEDGEALVRFEDATFVSRRTGLTPLGGAPSPADLQGRLVDAGTATDLGARATENPAPERLGQSVLLDAQDCLRRSSGPAHCFGTLAADETVVAASPDATFFVARRRSPGGATQVRLRTQTGVVELASINDDLDRRSWGAVVPIDHRGSEGQPLRSWLLLPAEATSSPPPVAVIAYPGLSFSAPPARLLPGSLQLHINPAVLSAAGYAVLMPSLPEQASPSLDLDDLGPELASIVRTACAADRCDAARAALIGHSFGGYGVLRAATQTDRFKAIIASNGYADLTEAYEPRLHSRLSGEAGVSIQSGWLEGGQGGLGVPLGTNPRRYVERSPLYAVDRIHTPTLLIESDFDGSRFESIFGALYRLNREAELVTYFGESHEFVSPANIRDLHLRILEWLNRYLGPSHAIEPRLPASRPNLDRTEDQEAVGRGIPD